MSSQALYLIIISIFSIDYLTETFLNYLNLKHQKNELPDELKDVYDAEKFRKSQEYFKVNAKFGFISSAFSFVVTLCVLVFGIFGILDAELKALYESPFIISLAFFGIVFLASDVINLPFALYRTFVIEERFGFNKTNLKTFFTDKLKGYTLGAIVGGALLSAFLWLVLTLGKDFWLWFWLILSVVILFINMFYTSLIVPLFNKLTKLEEGELRTAIEEYSKKNTFSLSNVFVIDGSKRSAKANAFFSGIGSKKKVVLYDTLINNHSIKELVAVLAHEVGHYKKKHIIQGFVFAIIQTGLMLFLLSLFIFSTKLSEALGTESLSIPVNLIAFGILYSPVSHLSGIFMNIVSRKNEYEADRFAAQTYNGEALAAALKKLSSDNLSNLTPHPAYVFMHYSHPPLLYRLRALAAIKNQKLLS